MVPVANTGGKHIVMDPGKTRIGAPCFLSYRHVATRGKLCCFLYLARPFLAGLFLIMMRSRCAAPRHFVPFD